MCRKWSELAMLTDTEHAQVLDEFNDTAFGDPLVRTIPELFAQPARCTPNAIAAVYEQQSLTYAELNARANQLAWYLRNKGVVPDQLVGICVERSLDMLVGLIGILKAGGAYVPLDPAYPLERLEFMLKDAAPKALVTLGQIREKLPNTTTELIALDEDRSRIAQCPASDVDASTELKPRSDNLAYVIYTSGSTGAPKGVMIEHRNVVNLWLGLERIYKRSIACQRIALNASLSFDASVQQIVQLLSARTLFIIPQEARQDPSMLLSFIEKNQIEAIDCTPSQLKIWIASGLFKHRHALRLVLVGGEAIDANLWHTLSQCSEIDFFNVYGPTECTVDATVARVNQDLTAPHIGRPMKNRRVYILDDYGEPVAVGSVGEIYVGGAGIGRGYLNQPELTQERFVADRFAADANARTYKTGDLGKWRVDGSIEYLGRNDNQVKIRGFRIELGEIEAQLIRHELVKDAVVIAREHEPGERRLVAYVICRDEAQPPSVEALRSHLTEVLPTYMVPSTFVMLDLLPLTPSGKVDRHALPAPVLEASASKPYEAPQGEIEEALAAMWQQILRVDRIGRNDHFFELGADSLATMRLVASVAERFSISFQTPTVFNNPTFEKMAGCVEALLATGAWLSPTTQAELEEGVI